MSDDLELKRLVDSPDAPSEMRAMLVAGATEDIDYDFDRGLAAHLGAIGAPVPPASSATASAAKGTALLSAKAWIALATASAAIVSASALWLAHASHSKSVDGGSLPPKVAAPSPGEDHQAAEMPAGDAPRVLPRATDGESAPGAAPKMPAPVRRLIGAKRGGGSGASESAVQDPTAPAAVTLAESDETGAQAPSTAHGASIAGSANGAAVSPAPSESAAAEQRLDGETMAREEDARKARAEADRKAENERLSREMDEVVQAKRALASDPALALSLAQKGQQEFPHGVLTEEREHILILALIGLGRIDEAKRRAAPYLERHPESPFARRVQHALDASARGR